jgi:RNA polymerase sigma factor (sigma-70 family)
MATGRLSGVIRDLCRTVCECSGRSDGELLRAFVARREEAAFAELVRRHGPMVLGVCRRVLRHEQDAEDAFQAPFLVLARRAGSVVPGERVGSWLHGVARRTALAARGAITRRRGREKQAHALPEPPVEPEGPWRELWPLLDAELARLPEKYRLPLLLCDLEGRTRREVARQLGLPEGTLSNRLAAARRVLAGRLARHGYTLAAGLLTTGLSWGAAARVPRALLLSTVKAATAGVVPGRAAALAEGVLKAMFLTRLRLSAALLVMILALACGVGALAQRGLAWARPGAPAPAAKAPAKQDHLKNTLVALDRVLWDAFARHDPEPAEKLMAAEFVGFSNDGRSNKKQNVATYTYLRGVDVKITDVEVFRVSPDTAILTYVYSSRVLSREGALVQVRRNRRTSNTWVQRGGGWVLVFAQEFVRSGGQ